MRGWMIGAVLAWLSGPGLAADEVAPNRRPVKVVAEARLPVGRGMLPIYVSRDWSAPLPEVDRAVIVLHGLLRNADSYYRSALKAQAAAGDAGRGAIMIVPQFLAGVDVEAHGLPAATLRWTRAGWEGGDAALGPEPLSSFEALDAILARLADRRLFPGLRTVVVAGHSGGAQVAQRYAVAGRGQEALDQLGIATRYVVASPSSYVYFSPERPEPAIAAACPGYDVWKYGMEKRPAYLAEPSPATLERQYVSRRVIYLLGTRDIDPDQQALDKSCMGEAQGRHRYARGHVYFLAMKLRDGGTLNHTLRDVPGVGHDGDRMLTSACGLAALFDAGGC